MSDLENIIKKCCICNKIAFRGKYEKLRIIPENIVKYTHTYCHECYKKELQKYGFEGEFK